MPTQYGIIIRDGINYSHDTASSISFNNSGGGGLSSNNVQDAINELNTKISTKANKSGEIFNGRIIINANESTVGNYDEGLRINRAFNGFYGVIMGGQSGTTHNTEDGEWWIGGNYSLLGRKLYIAHNGSTDCDTYFEVNSATDRHPKLHITNTGGVASLNYHAINGDDVFRHIAATEIVFNFTNAKCNSAYEIRGQKLLNVVRICTVINPSQDIAANEALSTIPDAAYRPRDNYAYFVSSKDIIIQAYGDGTIGVANISATIPAGWYYPLNMVYMTS